jgi:hypothetical protein
MYPGILRLPKFELLSIVLIYQFLYSVIDLLAKVIPLNC